MNPMCLIQKLSEQRLFQAALAIVSLAAVVPIAAAASRPAPTLDRSFGEDGRALSSLGATMGTSNFLAMSRQPDGKLLIGVERKSAAGGSGFAVARRNPDGSLDAAFGEGGTVEVPTADALTPQGDGGFLVHTQPFGCALVDSLRRYLPTGAPDTGFGSGGESARVPFEIDEIAVAPDGKIVVAGSARSFPCGKLAPTPETALARFNRDGSLDASFGSGGVVASVSFSPGSGPSGLAVDGEGRAIVTASGVIFRLRADGTPDPAFGEGGAVKLSGSPSQPALTPTGRILVLDNLKYTEKRDADWVLFEFESSGAPATDFGGGGRVAFGPPGESAEFSALALGADGSILVAGSRAACAMCPAHPAIERFNAGGARDAVFAANPGLEPTPLLEKRADPRGPQIAVHDLVVLAGGEVIVAGGMFSGEGGFLAEILPSGAVDPAFGSGGFVYETRPLPGRNGVRWVAATKRGAIYVTGFSNVAETVEPKSILIRYTPDGRLDTGFGDGTGYLRPPPDRWFANQAPPVTARRDDCFLLLSSERRFFVAHVRANGGFDRSFGRDGLAPLPKGLFPHSLILSGGERPLVAGRMPGGMAAVRLTRHGDRDRSFSGDGLVLVPFGKRTRTVAKAAGTQPGGRLLLVGHADRLTAAVRLRPDGSVDPSFGRRGRFLLSTARWSEASGLLVRKDGRAVLIVNKRGPRGVELLGLTASGRRDRGFAGGGSVELFGGGNLLAVLPAGKGRMLSIEARPAGQKHGVRLRVIRPDGAIGGSASAAVGQQPPFFTADGAIDGRGRVVVAGTAGRGDPGDQIELLRFAFR